MKYLISSLVLSILLLTFGCSQNDNKKEEPISKTEVKSTAVKTAAHVQVKLPGLWERAKNMPIL